MKNIAWTSVAIMLGLPALLGFVAWLIWILSDPASWCGIPVGAAKETGQHLPIADCTSIVLELIHWLGWFGVALIVCISVAFLTIVARDLKAFLDFSGPLDTHLRTGGEPTPPVATMTTTTTTLATPPPPTEAKP